MRERLTAGDSNADVLAYMVARYGDYVLLEPPVKPSTWLLWAAPPLVLLLGAVGLLLALRRRRALAPAAPLDAEERRRLERLLADGER